KPHGGVSRGLPAGQDRAGRLEGGIPHYSAPWRLCALATWRTMLNAESQGRQDAKFQIAHPHPSRPVGRLLTSSTASSSWNSIHKRLETAVEHMEVVPPAEVWTFSWDHVLCNSCTKGADPQIANLKDCPAPRRRIVGGALGSARASRG